METGSATYCCRGSVGYSIWGLEWAVSVQSDTVTWPIFVPFGFKYLLFKSYFFSLWFGLCLLWLYLRRVWHWFLTPVGHQAITWLAHIFLLEGASKIVFVTVGKVWSDEWQVYVYKCMSQRQMGGGCIQSPSLSKTLMEPIIMLWQENSPRYICFFPNTDRKSPEEQL